MTVLSAHALIIGVSQYQHIWPLPLVTDAEDLAGVLRDPSACGCDPANVLLLQESDATRARILDELEQLAGRAGQDATALVYFSGHGGRSPEGGDSYLLPIDGAWGTKERLKATAISSQQLSDKLGAIDARQLLIVLDCCHVAGLAQARDVASEWVAELAADALDRLAAGRGRVVMAAARGDGAAYVLGGARHGLFTEHLIAGLRGAAGRADGFVRARSLRPRAAQCRRPSACAAAGAEDRARGQLCRGAIAERTAHARRAAAEQPCLRRARGPCARRWRSRLGDVHAGPPAREARRAGLS